MDDLFDILIESGGKETKPAFPMVPGSESGECRALRGDGLSLSWPRSFPFSSALAIVIKALREMSVRP